MTKYTYGLAALATTILLEFTLLLWPALDVQPVPPAAASRRTVFLPDFAYVWSLRRQATRRYLWLFGPFLLGVALWFAAPGNLALFADYVTAQPEGAFSMTLEDLLFYPRSIAASQAPAPIFVLLTLLSLLWSLRRWRKVATRLLLLYFFVGLVMMTINRPLNPRFIATFVPAVHVLTGLMVARLVFNSATRRSPSRVAAMMGASAVVIFALCLPTVVQRFRQYPAHVTVAYETDPALAELAAWIGANIPQERRFFLVNYWDHFGPQTLAWQLGKSALAVDRQARFSDVLMPSALLGPASPQRAQALRQDIVASGVAYVVVLEGGPWGSPFWPEYSAALQDSLEHTSETVMTIPRPVAPGEWQALNVKAIVYRWHGGQ